jgi:hypothetical protein
MECLSFGQCSQPGPADLERVGQCVRFHLPAFHEGEVMDVLVGLEPLVLGFTYSPVGAI